MAWFLRNQDFAEERGLEPKVKTFKLGEALSKLVYLRRITDWGRSLQPPEAMGGLGPKPAAAGRFLYCLKKIEILMPLRHILNVLEQLERIKFLSFENQ